MKYVILKIINKLYFKLQSPEIKLKGDLYITP